MAEMFMIHNKNNSHVVEHAKLIGQLEQQFNTITQLLYTTSVSNELLDQQVMPYIADDVIFKDPWQEGGPKQLYRVGMKGFHNMMHFTFDTFQLNVQLNDDGPKSGRCIVDGVMQLKQFSWIYTYPLRTILVYDFRLLSTDKQNPKFEIFRHEEMWSYCDMIDAIPGVGWIYKNVFRWGFGHMFVAVSALSDTVRHYFGQSSSSTTAPTNKKKD